MLIFVEFSILVLIVGVLYWFVFDCLGILREKLVYIVDFSFVLVSILIFFNGWGVFIMGLLVVEGFSDFFVMMFKVMVYNFYFILVLILVLVIIFSKKDFGFMVKVEKWVWEMGKLFNDNFKFMVLDELMEVEMVEGVMLKVFNMIIFIFIMVLLMFVMLVYIGWEIVIVDLLGVSMVW